MIELLVISWPDSVIRMRIQRLPYYSTGNVLLGPHQKKGIESILKNKQSEATPTGYSSNDDNVNEQIRRLSLAEFLAIMNHVERTVRPRILISHQLTTSFNYQSNAPRSIRHFQGPK